MTVSFTGQTAQTLSRVSPLKPLQTANDYPARSPIRQIGSTALEACLGSILVLTEDAQVLYTSEGLQPRLEELTETNQESTVVTPEIALICQALKQSRDCFPTQHWAIEFDIVTRKATVLHIRSRWLKLEGYDQPCILLVVEDRQQLIRDRVQDEIDDWGLTAREQEVWLLHCDGYTYHQIAEKLYITINTVKKHMRSVHAKRRSQSDLELEPQHGQRNVA